MRKPRKLTGRERGRFGPWLERLAGGDREVLRLLWLSLGRIAVAKLEATLDADPAGRGIKFGDGLRSRPPHGWDRAIAAWITAAVAEDANWLRDVDEDDRPVRLTRCEDHAALLAEVRADFGEREYALPQP